MNRTVNNKLLLSLALILITFISGAQTVRTVFGKTINADEVNPANGKIRCVSAEYEQYLEEKDPQRKQSKEFEQWLAPKLQAVKAQRTSSPQNTTTVYTIPVVVHVIHNGDAVGSNENIADEQVISQITVLNQDFRRQSGTPGYNTNTVGADTQIEFCLAQVDPDGNPTNGIDRVNLGQASWNSENSIENTMKPGTQWDPTKYFNIWVCNFGGGMSDILGYAQFPSASGLSGISNWGGYDDTDGVVIGYKYFGSIYEYEGGNYDWTYFQGRTATHEIGHCLGLIHIWGNNGGCTDDDYCDDTPSASAPNYGCTPNYSCSNQDMIQNYMDYTDDYCMNIFTQDQKDRMIAVLQNSPRRMELLTSNVCQGSNAGREDFELLNGIALYPNPTSNVLNITMGGNDLPDSYVIYNSLGQEMANVKVSSVSNLTVNTSAYSSGIYFIKIDKGTQSKKLKFIKN